MRSVSPSPETKFKTLRQPLVRPMVLLSLVLLGIGSVGLAAEWYLRSRVPIDWTVEYRIPNSVLGWSLAPEARFTTYVPEPVEILSLIHI